MSRNFININDHDVVLHTQRLEKLHRSAMPLAVRDTLSGLAFHVKGKSMPQETDRAFVKRSKNFFRANSRVKPAKGRDMNKMEALFGFINGDKFQAIEDLEKQETGGVIDGRAFIPMATARTSKSDKKMVARRNRLSKINNVVSVGSVSGKNRKQKFIKAGVKAGVGGYIVTDSQMLKVTSVRRKGKNTFLKVIPLYSYKEGRSVKVRGKRFLDKAVKSTMRESSVMFIKNADRQIKRLG